MRNALFLWIAFVGSATAQNNGDLRLSRGFSSSTTYRSGRLEIYYNGQWGTVCDDSWGILDSDVACQQLGYFGAISPYYATSSNTRFGSGTGQIWLDDVGCTGSESRLTFCRNRGGFGSHNCGHSEDVAIYCSSVRISSTFTSPPTSTSATCASYQWTCSNGQCISSSYRCDGGTPDCTDGSDELNCFSSAVSIGVGVSISCLVVFVIIPIVICVVIACVASRSSSRRTRTTVTAVPSTPSTTVVTTSSQQQSAQQSAYPAAGTDFKQAPPPPYEMSAYPPQPQQSYPQQGYPQQGYPAQGYPEYPPKQEGAYPPQGYPTQGYPQQGYPAQPEGAYPAQGYPPQP